MLVGDDVGSVEGMPVKVVGTALGEVVGLCVIVGEDVGRVCVGYGDIEGANVGLILTKVVGD